VSSGKASSSAARASREAPLRTEATPNEGSKRAMVTWKMASLAAASAGDATTALPDTRKVSRSPNATSIGLRDGLKLRSLRPSSARATLIAAHSPICIA
jgi:hypothetical protein